MPLPTNVFIEATDSSPDPASIEFALSYANVQTTFPGSKIVAGVQFPPELLENEAVFPHYFTL